MKPKNYLFLFVILLMVNACKKKVDNIPTSYQTLGTYDTSGRPNILLKDSISPSFLSFSDSTLPDGIDLRIKHPELFTSLGNADTKITQTSDLYVTFVSATSLCTSSIGFYSYPTNQPPSSPSDIKLITYIFPNTGGRIKILNPGDKVKIGRFDAGMSVGFVLLQNGWDFKTQAVNSNATQFFTTDAINLEADPTLKRHAVLINYVPENKVLICMKDTDRSSPLCDNDFNDFVFYCTLTP
jgi:hypothetical protein